MNSILPNEVGENTLYIPEARVLPTISDSATIRNSQITGNVTVDKNVHIVNAVLRADEGGPFYVGEGSNIQDFAVLHGYTNRQNGAGPCINLLEIENKGYFSIYIDKKVSLSHGTLVHGPAYIGENTFIGFKATIDAATIGKNVEIGAHSYIRKVAIPDNIAIAPNATILCEKDIDKYKIEHSGINKTIADVNIEMAKVYNNR